MLKKKQHKLKKKYNNKKQIKEFVENSPIETAEVIMAPNEEVSPVIEEPKQEVVAEAPVAVEEQSSEEAPKKGRRPNRGASKNTKRKTTSRKKSTTEE